MRWMKSTCWGLPLGCRSRRAPAGTSSGRRKWKQKHGFQGDWFWLVVSNTSLSINMEPKMEVWKMIFLFNWVIFGFYVNFQGCILYFHPYSIWLHFVIPPCCQNPVTKNDSAWTCAPTGFVGFLTPLQPLWQHMHPKPALTCLGWDSQDSLVHWFRMIGLGIRLATCLQSRLTSWWVCVCVRILL